MKRKQPLRMEIAVDLTYMAEDARWMEAKRIINRLVNTATIGETDKVKLAYEDEIEEVEASDFI